MNDPYTPPSAEIADAAGPGGRTGWKIYLWVMAALIGLVLAMGLVLGVDWVQVADVLDVAISIVGLWGLFGYAYRKALFGPGFWKAWLPLQVTWDALAVFVLTRIGLAYALPDSEPTSLFEDAIGIALLVPLYVALYRYAWRSGEIWRGR